MRVCVCFRGQSYIVELYVCVCVYEREAERKEGRAVMQRNVCYDAEVCVWGRERQRERVCVLVHRLTQQTCVRERDGESEHVCVCSSVELDTTVVVCEGTREGYDTHNHIM